MECSGKKVRAGSGILKRSNYFKINLQNCLTGAASAKKWVFKAAVIGPFKHTELLGAAGVGQALTNAQTVH